MATEIAKIANKSLNVPKLTEELAAAGVPRASMTFHGFLRSVDDVVAPDPAASGTATLDFGGGDVPNEPGLIAYATEQPLGAPEETQLDTVLAAHDHTILTVEQTRRLTDASGFTTLRAQWGNIGTMNDTQLRQYVAQLARSYLRRIGPSGTRDLD